MIKRRQTESKTKLFDFLKKNSTAVPFEVIEENMKESMDRVTIYRILKSFETDGLVHKIINENKKVYYALCHTCVQEHHTHNHIHFNCSHCGKMECLGEEITTKIPEGYVLTKIQFTATGLCQKCNLETQLN